MSINTDAIRRLIDAEMNGATEPDDSRLPGETYLEMRHRKSDEIAAWGQKLDAREKLGRLLRDRRNLLRLLDELERLRGVESRCAALQADWAEQGSQLPQLTAEHGIDSAKARTLAELLNMFPARLAEAVSGEAAR